MRRRATRCSSATRALRPSSCGRLLPGRGPHAQRGWWENLIGPGRPLDTRKFFVIGLSNLGGCHGSTGPGTVDPTTGQPFGSDFPVVTVRTGWRRSGDWRTTSALTLSRRFGGSLGGMRRRCNGRSCTPSGCATCSYRRRAKLSAENIGFQRGGAAPFVPTRIFMTGTSTRTAWCRAAVALVAHAQHLTCCQMIDGREIRPPAQGEDYRLASMSSSVELSAPSGRQIRRLLRRQHHLLMTKALDYFDPAKDFGGDLNAAFARSTASFSSPPLPATGAAGALRSWCVPARQQARCQLRRDRSRSRARLILMPIPRYHALLRATFEGITV